MAQEMGEAQEEPRMFAMLSDRETAAHRAQVTSGTEAEESQAQVEPQTSLRRQEREERVEALFSSGVDPGPGRT